MKWFLSQALEQQWKNQDKKKKNISQMSFRALHLKEKNKPGP